MERTHASMIREKCGVVGVWTTDTFAPYVVRRALASLQHRGQESAGMSVLSPEGKISTHKDMGLVPHVLTEQVIKKLGPGHTAIGQNRYATFGRSHSGNAQPIAFTNGPFQLSLGHNGNIPNVTNIKQLLGLKNSASGDTELMTALLHKERKNYKNWEETFYQILPQFHGAYSLVILTNDGSLFGIRDPYGIRPLCLGKLENGWIIASESAALDSIGADFIREVKPGEIIKITSKGKLSSSFFGEPRRPQPCIFECVYFDRPDSFVNGIRIRAGREMSGRLLAKRIQQKGINPDVVVPTFDSGYPAAKGAAQELGVPMVDAITTSHYVGRTFIQPGQSNRISAVNGKHNIVPDEIVGKSVVIVDDSGVRLTTSTALVKKFREAGVKKIYLGFASPPVVNQCDLGIDMREKKELPASQFENEPFNVIEEKVAKYVGADAVTYLPIEETAKAFGSTPKNFYYTPFGGPHPIRGKQETFPKLKKIITAKPKICVFASILSKGSNLENVINHIENKDMQAEIIEVLANRKESYSLVRAKNHNIPATVIPFEGSFSDKSARHAYENKLVNHIQKIKPDIILLSGWSIVLSDYFLEEMQKLQIPVINHHPALLTNDASDMVATSMGVIPVIRGNNKFEASYESGILISGISVHQVLPGNMFDVGPVVMKAEVRRIPGETLETWEKRNREAEYLLLPTALKRIIHVLKHNIDISKEDFPWGN